MPFSAYLKEKWLEHAFGGAAFTQPSEWWVQLHTGDPGSAGTSNAASETTRKEITDWADFAGGVLSSAAAVSWTNYPATETISHISIWDAETTGNFLGSGALASSIPMVGPGSNVLTISSGDIDIFIADS